MSPSSKWEGSLNLTRMQTANLHSFPGLSRPHGWLFSGGGAKQSLLSNPETAVSPVGQNKLLFLTTQKEHKLSHLGDMGSKKVKVNYFMIIITSSIIKSDNNHIWDEPKEYFKHHQCIRHKERGLYKADKRQTYIYYPRLNSSLGSEDRQQKKQCLSFFCCCCGESSSLSQQLPKETLISETFKDNIFRTLIL